MRCVSGAIGKKREQAVFLAGAAAVVFCRHSTCCRGRVDVVNGRKLIALRRLVTAWPPVFVGSVAVLVVDSSSAIIKSVRLSIAGCIVDRLLNIVESNPAIVENFARIRRANNYRSIVKMLSPYARLSVVKLRRRIRKAAAVVGDALRLQGFMAIERGAVAS
jgi:hypothetical protein